MTVEALFQPSLSLRLQLAIKSTSGATMRELMEIAGTDPSSLEDVSDAEILLHNLREMGHVVRDRRPPSTLDDRYALTEAGHEFLMVVVPSGECPDIEVREIAA